jgi:hypothetical protein
MKKILLLVLALLSCLSLSACDSDYDTIEIYNENEAPWDNVYIETPLGYFYDKHEKCTVDNDTVAVIIYFKTQDASDEWDNQLELNSEKEQDNDRCN